MGRSTGFIQLLVIVVAVGGYLYMSQLKQVAATGDAPATVVAAPRV